VSRRSNRSRGRALAVKARRPPANPGGVTLTGDQLAGIFAAQQRAGQLAAPMPRPAAWSADAFPPGQPLTPAPINRRRTDTGRAEPRLFELPISSNLNINTAPYVPWRVLSEAADMPLFRKCIERRKGVCDLDFQVVVDPKAVAREAAAAGQHEKDVESGLRDKYAADIVRISDWLETPDAQNDQDWTVWTKALMENRLVYDAVAVYPQVSYGGDLLSLRVVDGSTIKPLLDEYGARPAPPFPFAQQILYGFPRGEFSATTVPGPDGKPTVPGFAADELLYERTIYRPKTPYGMSACEIALLDGIVWLRRMGWILSEYTEGVMPAAHVEVDGATDWDVTEWETWQRSLNDHLGGNTAERMKFPLFPPGTKPVMSPTIPEQYKPEYDMFLVKLIAGDFGMTATELGFPEVGSLGASFHEGEEDVLNRVTRIPDANWLARIATKLARRHLAMPGQLMVKILGLESEDEAAADAVAAAQAASGRLTLNEDRARRGEPAYDFPEADMPMITGDRGIVFIEGASALAPPGTLIQPAAVKPGDPGDSASQNEEPGQAGQQPDDDADDDKGKPGQNANQRMAGPGQKPGTAKAAGATLGYQAHQAAILARAMTATEEELPGSAAAEIAAYRRWARKGGQRGRFACAVVTKASAPALAPDMAADERVLFKDGDSGGPKAPASRGLAGSGTRS
jgi:hypothetical protein